MFWLRPNTQTTPPTHLKFSLSWRQETFKLLLALRANIIVESGAPFCVGIADGSTQILSPLRGKLKSAVKWG